MFLEPCNIVSAMSHTLIASSKAQLRETRSPTDLALSCAARLLRLGWNSSVRRQAPGAVVGAAHRTAAVERSSGRVSCSALLGRSRLAAADGVGLFQEVKVPEHQLGRGARDDLSG